MEHWRKNGVLTLRPRPEDLSDPKKVTDVLEKTLHHFGDRNVIVDMSLADSLTSLQLGTLVTIHLVCYENLAVMRLASVSSKVKLVLRLIGLDQIMHCHHGEKVVNESFGAEGEAPPAEGQNADEA